MTVKAGDGTDEATAAITVALGNRNEAPTANAGEDQSSVAEGATVTLSATGEDPDAGDTLQYAWTQTGGNTVTLSAPSAAVTTFTAPSGLTENTVLTFALQLTDDGSLTSTDTVEVTVVVTDTSSVTASFHAMPPSHNGTNTFAFELRFSEQVSVGYEKIRDSVFTLTNGQVTGARRLARPSNVRWEVTVTPTSIEDITIVLSGNRACGTAAAICTSNGRQLTGSIRATVAKLPLTASLVGVPAEHDGETSFPFELRFSEEVSVGYEKMRDRVFTVTNGRVTGARRLAPPSNLRWGITVEPTSAEDITIVLPGGRTCNESRAVCTASGKQLSNSPSATVN